MDTVPAEAGHAEAGRLLCGEHDDLQRLGRLEPRILQRLHRSIMNTFKDTGCEYIIPSNYKFQQCTPGVGGRKQSSCCRFRAV